MLHINDDFYYQVADYAINQQIGTTENYVVNDVNVTVEVNDIAEPPVVYLDIESDWDDDFFYDAMENCGNGICPDFDEDGNAIWDFEYDEE